MMVQSDVYPAVLKDAKWVDDEYSTDGRRGRGESGGMPFEIPKVCEKDSDVQDEVG